jgi:hypothetical protein
MRFFELYHRWYGVWRSVDATPIPFCWASIVDECFCGNNLVNGATTTDEADCNMGCLGNNTFVWKIIRFISYFDTFASQACGGPNRVSVYSSALITTFPVPSAHVSDLPGQWQYKGCLRWVYKIGTEWSYRIWYSQPDLGNLPFLRCFRIWLIGQVTTLLWCVWINVANSVLLQQESRWVMLAMACT